MSEDRAVSTDWYNEGAAICHCNHAHNEHAGKAFRYACAVAGCACDGFHERPAPTDARPGETTLMCGACGNEMAAQSGADGTWFACEEKDCLDRGNFQAYLAPLSPRAALAQEEGR